MPRMWAEGPDTGSAWEGLEALSGVQGESMKIEPYPAGRLLLSDPMLTEDMQRELIKYIWKHKPEMIREIICKNCPEVIR